MATPSLRAHVFAIDWVPEAGDVAGGGGLRSLQIIEALRARGHTVSVSVPRASRAVREIAVRAPERLRGIELHDTRNQIDLLHAHRPDVVAWLWPTVRRVPFNGMGEMVQLCDLNGLQDFESANGTPTLLRLAQARIADSCRGADVVLTGSTEQYGYWRARLGEGVGAQEVAVAGYALPASLLRPGVRKPGTLRRLHFTGNLYHWSASAELLGAVAAWVAGRKGLRLEVIGGTDPGGATALAELRALHALEGNPAVALLGETAFGAAMDRYGPGSLALDLSLPSTERSLAVPVRTVNALSHGVPVLSTIDSPLTRRMRQAGAGVIAAGGAEGLASALNALAALPEAAFTAMSAAARRFAQAEFAPEAPAEAMAEAIAVAQDRRRARLVGWRAGAGKRDTLRGGALGHVLVVSSEYPNIRELRVEIPFGSLHRRGAMAGYTVWDQRRVVFSTSAEPGRESFDAIWVQRSISAEVALILDGLGVPFVYDIDDNLLVSPSYRAPFAPESVQAVRGFVRSAAVVSASTARLAAVLQKHVGTRVVEKTVVTPNLARAAPAARPAGAPGCVVWASSDTPALTDQRVAVETALRDFCLTHDTRLVCVGARPPPLLAESEVAVEHVGLLPYAAYLDLIRGLAPAILFCPMEIAGDEATQDFIDGKSDIKMLEALTCGLVGVFSAARVYVESALPGAILFENSYRGVFEALMRARRACLAGGEAPVVPAARLAGGDGALPYHEALLRVRLERPVTLATLTDRLNLIRGRMRRRKLGPDEFDAEFYVEKYPDVRFALERGTIGSVYQHYALTGYAEQRMGREGDTAEERGAQFWANLMHTVGDLRNAVAVRTEQIEELKTRRAMRLRMRQSGR